MCEPFLYRPWEVERLTDAQAEDLLAAAGERAEAVRRTAAGEGETPLQAKLRRGECPTFEEYWAGFYCLMPGATLERAKIDYAEQKAEWEAQQAARRPG